MLQGIECTSLTAPFTGPGEGKFTLMNDQENGSNGDATVIKRPYYLSSVFWLRRGMLSCVYESHRLI